MESFKAVMLLAAAGLLAGCVQETAGSGQSDYETLCAGCHGATGRGEGPAAASLDMAVPDLTQIAARNGGEFPLVDVMAQIDGYTREQSHAGMPAFWPLLEGETVMIKTDPGIFTPTPARLVALARYLESIQD